MQSLLRPFFPFDLLQSPFFHFFPKNLPCNNSFINMAGNASSIMEMLFVCQLLQPIAFLVISQKRRMVLYHATIFLSIHQVNQVNQVNCPWIPLSFLVYSTLKATFFHHHHHHHHHHNVLAQAIFNSKNHST